MKAVSHKQLGAYLVDQYIADAPKRYIRAFKLGCVEPDKNPATYLKGSFRHQWLRGHNWSNMGNYLEKLSSKLEEKAKMRMLDFYKLGKLIHYIADAFTLAHNSSFDRNLKVHREYETRLEEYFPLLLGFYKHSYVPFTRTVADMIYIFHKDYIHRPQSIYTDAAFSVTVCSSVLKRILDEKQLSYA